MLSSSLIPLIKIILFYMLHGKLTIHQGQNVLEVTLIFVSFA